MLLRPLAAVVLVVVWAGCAGGAAGEPVELLATDALPVEARGFGSGERAVVLAGRHEPAAWAPLADGLAEEGYRVLAVRVRSDDRPSVAGRDVLGAVRSLEGSEPVVLAEGSTVPAAVWAAGEGTVAGLVLVSPPPAAAGTEVRRLRVPKLLVAGAGDTEGMEGLQALAADSPPPIDVRTYPGGSRGLELLTGREGRAVRADMLAFLERVLEVP